jgi:hypothetical protein
MHVEPLRSRRSSVTRLAIALLAAATVLGGCYYDPYYGYYRPYYGYYRPYYYGAYGPGYGSAPYPGYYYGH